MAEDELAVVKRLLQGIPIDSLYRFYANIKRTRKPAVNFSLNGRTILVRRSLAKCLVEAEIDRRKS